MGVYDRNIVYCPVCGMIAFPEQNVVGKTIFPERLKDGKCPWCETQLLEVTDRTYEEIAADENANWLRPTKPMPEIRKVIEDDYIFPETNELFNPEAYKKRCRKERVGSRLAMRQAQLELASSSPTCPRCGSKSISTQKQGFGAGKAAAGAVAGAVVAGPVGLAGAAAGAVGANKVYNVCQNCGHKWEPGK